ncbi:DNA alkylation repair protein [Aquimarina mytili]|uniref:DNA alkylation repair protein n=1 Tax=Aquimarina mytili TaxID=874423 RepID=A0A937A152_9FLAO|nr:DNA alkylation repair protein [Aquimarina mytili]MBL0684946.1 DNA alkylation repair protein [Aquimarina mytili]
MKKYVDQCVLVYQSKGLTECVNELHDLVLNRKVRFPLLEFCAKTLYQEIFEDEHIDFCDQIEALHTEGGNVILGIMLQIRLKDSFKQSIEKATEYVSNADIWYVCDIIGERVFGYALLHWPSKTIPEIKRLSSHSSNWVIRSLGAGVHYAIKKGLDQNSVKTVFRLLLSMANTKDKEIRQGIGWAAKTTAKFHPDVIDFFQKEIDNKERVAHWFRTKISIGLNRNDYAKRD